MLAAAAVDLVFDEDDWLSPAPPLLYRSTSIGNSWGVTSIGRGFDWSVKDDDKVDVISQPQCPLEKKPPNISQDLPKREDSNKPAMATRPSLLVSPVSVRLLSEAQFSSLGHGPVTISPSASTPNLTDSPISDYPSRSLSRLSLHSATPLQPNVSEAHRPPLPRSPTLPRPRRRSSQQRVSLIAGRVLIAPIEPPSPPPMMPQILHRSESTGSLLRSVASTGPPTPAREAASLPDVRTISDFFIEGEIGRGAYGLVKRVREYKTDGSLGPPLVLKQIIKSRILADCWKRHPRFGTIPIEIFVMSVISSTSYTLPAIRPWDPSRHRPSTRIDGETECSQPDCACVHRDGRWEEGKEVKGHPNICPLLDFFEDNHYYYLVLPSSTPEQKLDESPPPTDLFDLVEAYPQGLPPFDVRSYLGQLADALCFLHSHGIVHRDIKDENVVLGPVGKCILIDFGSSGLVKKNGWDTFSGTLDYAGPEILRGERYYGKEQDVWAFGIVAYVLLVGECPFVTAAEAQEGLTSPFANASIALDERCGDDKEKEGEEDDGGGAAGDAAALVRACLQVDVGARPTFESILQCRFLKGGKGWGMELPIGNHQHISPQPSAFPARVT
ncbi:kinase-like protein [Suillus paluster]|uniref:kinase-like protein n=1 Tax=Suillus paluster TaxID=48578 RepID=UPI001B871165|nr:kinase-like protein [Suillus paluster]KAG1755237.1 kinase-like protein [Suillus paluster]